MKKITLLILSILLLASCEFTQYTVDTKTEIPEENMDEYREYVKELMETAHPGHYTAGKGKHLDDVIYGVANVARSTFQKDLPALKAYWGGYSYTLVSDLDSVKLEIYEYVLEYGTIKIRDKYPQELKYKYPYKGQKPQ